MFVVVGNIIGLIGKFMGFRRFIVLVVELGADVVWGVICDCLSKGFLFFVN